MHINIHPIIYEYSCRWMYCSTMYSNPNIPVGTEGCNKGNHAFLLSPLSSLRQRFQWSFRRRIRTLYTVDLKYNVSQRRAQSCWYSSTIRMFRNTMVELEKTQRRRSMTCSFTQKGYSTSRHTFIKTTTSILPIVIIGSYRLHGRSGWEKRNIQGFPRGG